MHDYTFLIEEKCITDFERKLFRAALNNLVDLKNPLRLNNFCYAMREFIRIKINTHAPDERVICCSWYKKPPKCSTTRAQRIKYMIQGFLHDEIIKNIVRVDIDSKVEKIVQIYDQLNKYTHIEEDVFENFSLEQTIKNDVLACVYTILYEEEDIHKIILSKLEDELFELSEENISEDVIGEIDSLATHHYIKEIITNGIEIRDINPAGIIIEIEGSIECDMQIGSNSDARKGDAINFIHSFPFTIMAECNDITLEEIEFDKSSLTVSEGSWRD